MITGFTVLLNESQPEFDALSKRLHDEWDPEGEHECFLIRQMAEARWRLARYNRLEQIALDSLMLAVEAGEPTPEERIIATLTSKGRDALTVIDRLRASAELSYHRAHRELIRGRKADQQFQSKAMDEYINKVVFAPLPGETPAGQKPTEATNGSVSQKGQPSTKTPIAQTLGNLALRL